MKMSIMRMITSHYIMISLISCALAVWGCDDEPKPTREVSSGEAMGGATPETDSEVSDLGMPDQGTPDAELPPHLEAPRARIFLSDPVHDEGELTEVEMRQTTDVSGALTSDAVQVFNCLNEEGGVTGSISMGINIEVSLCREAQVARPDPDGHYLSIEPPEDFTDPNDSFAELMMYHHVNEIADYYLTKHEYSRYDEPLPALVNVQIKTNPVLPFDGFRPGPDGFIPLDNALFFPKESWQQFAAQFGLPARDTDLIVFFQGVADFAYDASVIYHEYTHAVIGINRLQGFVVDSYGLDASPSGMNEGLADYFAATALDLSEVGRYGIGSVNGGEGRDLEVGYGCPNDSHWEVHVHGRVIGSTMWEARQTLGAEVADRVMFDALELFNANTSHQEASEILLVEAEEEGPEVAEALREILLSHGMLDCVRSRPWERYRTSESRDRVPYSVAGRDMIGAPSLRIAGIPAYKQFSVRAPADQEFEGVKLSWRVIGQPTGFGGPPEDIPLWLSLRAGAPVEIEQEPVSYIEDHRLYPPIENGVQTVILPKRCLVDDDGMPRDLHTLFINRARESVSITQMDIEWLDVIPEGVELSSCLPESEEMAGEPAGEMAGEPAGEMAGEPAGEMAGEPAGEMAGEPAGEMAGEPAGEMAGEPAGEMAGEPAGEMVGEPAGEMAGEPAGEMAGEPAGGVAGEMAGSEEG